MGRPLSSLCSPLAVLHIYCYRSFLRHATERLIIHSIIPPTADTHMCIYTQTHTDRGSHRKMIECASTQHESMTKHKCQITFQLNITLPLLTQGAPQAAHQGFYFTHLCHRFKYAWAGHVYNMVAVGTHSSKTSLQNNRVNQPCSVDEEILSRNYLLLAASGLTLRLLAEIKMCAGTKNSSKDLLKSGVLVITKHIPVRIIILARWRYHRCWLHYCAGWKLGWASDEHLDVYR